MTTTRITARQIKPGHRITFVADERGGYTSLVVALGDESIQVEGTDVTVHGLWGGSKEYPDELGLGGFDADDVVTDHGPA